MSPLFYSCILAYALHTTAFTVNRYNNAGSTSVMMSTSDSFSGKKNLAAQVAKTLATAIITASSFTLPPVNAVVTPTSITRLEQSIQALETADNKADVLQGLADVFEASESRTLLVRTKYKKVCITTIVTISKIFD